MTDLDSILNDVKNFYIDSEKENYHLIKDFPDKPLFTLNSLLKFTAMYYFNKTKGHCNGQRITHFIDENGNAVDINADGVNIGMTNSGMVIYWIRMGFTGEQKKLTPVYDI